MVNRRDFLIACASIYAICPALADKAATPGQPSACDPVISGTLWWCSPDQINNWGLAGWRKELQQQRELGFNLLWLSNAPSLIENEGFSLRQLLDACRDSGFQAIVDTGSTSNWFSPLDLKAELDLCRRNIKAIAAQVTGHPAFYGWYIPHEIYMDWGALDEYISQLYPALVESCKNAAAIPVALSPFFILDRAKVFGDFRYAEPDEYADYWARLIRKSGLDIIMLQDSGEHFSYVTDEQRRPFFQAMSKACGNAGARLWGNVEVAEMECDDIQDYVRRFGRVHHASAKGITWRPVPLDRLRTKLSLAAQHSQRIVSWGYQQFCRPELGANAAKWFRDYQVYHVAARKRP